MTTATLKPLDLGILSAVPPKIAMFSSQQQTLLEAMQSRRFMDSIPSLTIDKIIAIIHNGRLAIYDPGFVDWVLLHLKLVKHQAWISCGVKTVAIFCYGEIVNEFLTRDILVGNADVTFATLPSMTTATLEPIAESAPVSAPELPVDSPKPATELFTIAEIAAVAEKVGLSGTAIADEIRAINPKPFRWHGEELYELTVMDRAI